MRIFLGKEGRNELFENSPKICQIIHGWYPFICPDGVLIVPGDSHFIIRDIYKLNVYERNKIGKDDVVVDVGAHVGIFALKAARRGRLVIAVEPFPSNFKLLLMNTKINRLENVIPVNVALGSYDGEVELLIATRSCLHTISDFRQSTQEEISNKKLKVRLKTLDSLMHELGIKKIGFIKIDAEGAELDILKGASNILQNYAKIKVAVASYHLPNERENIENFLKQKGFKSVVSSKGILHAYSL